MGRIKKPVTLTEAEKSALNDIVKKGTHKSRKIIRARVLLLMNEGKDLAETQQQVKIGSGHFYKIKSRYFEGGLAHALEELPRSGQPRKVTEKLEAQITSIACSAAPAGSARWTLKLINEKVIELNYVESLSQESVRLILKKASANPGRKRCGVSAR